MSRDVVFLALPALVAGLGSVLLWLLARARRRRLTDDHSHLRAFRRVEGGATPPQELSGIVGLDTDPE